MSTFIYSEDYDVETWRYAPLNNLGSEAEITKVTSMHGAGYVVFVIGIKEPTVFNELYDAKVFCIFHVANFDNIALYGVPLSIDIPPEP